MRLLFLGDVVGRPGRRALGLLLPRLVVREAVQFVVANGENASGGKGIDPEGAEELLDAGVDVLTSGNHTHVQTADESILPAGTAYLTDAGMCGPDGSVLGVKTEQVLRRFLTQMPTRFEVASGPVLVQGALIDVDEASGRATAIRRVQERVTT